MYRKIFVPEEIIHALNHKSKVEKFLPQFNDDKDENENY